MTSFGADEFGFGDGQSLLYLTKAPVGGSLIRSFPIAGVSADSIG